MLFPSTITSCPSHAGGGGGRDAAAVLNRPGVQPDDLTAGRRGGQKLWARGQLSLSVGAAHHRALGARPFALAEAGSLWQRAVHLCSR